MDESDTKERYFIAALLVPGDAANDLSAALDGIVRRAHRGYDRVPRDAELHGYDIVAGKGDWAGLAGQARARIGVYNQAMPAVADHDVTVIVRSVDIPGLVRRYPGGHDHPHARWTRRGSAPGSRNS